MNFLTKSKGKPITVPTLAEVSPAITQLEQASARMMTERAQLLVEVACLRESIAAKGPIVTDQEQSRLNAIVAGSAAPDLDNRAEQLRATLKRVDDLNRAIEYANSRRSAAKAAASFKVCDPVRARNDELLEGIARALIVVHQLQSERHQLIYAVEARGADTGSIRELEGRILDHPRDHSSPMGFFLRDAAKQGLIKQTDVPEALR